MLAEAAAIKGGSGAAVGESWPSFARHRSAAAPNIPSFAPPIGGLLWPPDGVLLQHTSMPQRARKWSLVRDRRRLPPYSPSSALPLTLSGPYALMKLLSLPAVAADKDDAPNGPPPGHRSPASAPPPFPLTRRGQGEPHERFLQWAAHPNFPHHSTLLAGTPPGSGRPCFPFVSHAPHSVAAL